MPNKAQLDRAAYAEARGIGLSRAESARLAGSKARKVDALSKQGSRLESEEKVQTLIAEARERHLQGITDDLELGKARARMVLQSGDRVRWPEAWNFFAKLAGAFVQKHEHSGPDGGPMTLMRLVEEVDEDA